MEGVMVSVWVSPSVGTLGNRIYSAASAVLSHSCVWSWMQWLWGALSALACSLKVHQRPELCQVSGTFRVLLWVLRGCHLLSHVILLVFQNSPHQRNHVDTRSLLVLVGRAVSSAAGWLRVPLASFHGGESDRGSGVDKVKRRGRGRAPDSRAIWQNIGSI